MTKIKICGLRREEDISYVNECLPDYVGFVFAKGKRTVAKETAAHLRKLLAPQIVPVGVFVNEEIEVIARLVREGIIDAVQLHGDEDAAYIRKLRENIINDVTEERGANGDAAKSHSIIKAVRVATQEDVLGCEAIPADYLLFDTRMQGEYGGSGRKFDWELIKNVKRPYFLAGGIGEDNVCGAVERLAPYAIDVSSGVETDGYKDRTKILNMVEKVRGGCTWKREDTENTADSIYRKR